MKCECGCGEDVPIANRTDRKRNRVKGQSMRFVHGHNRRLPRLVRTSKRCSRCDQEKKVEEFYADKSKRDGLSAECRSCRKERAKSWYVENRERARDLSERWKQANPERYHAAKMRWQKTNLQKGAEKQRRRAVRLRGGRVEKIDPWFIYTRDGGRCHICHKRVAKKEMSLDHLIPVSKGGDHIAVNIRLAHLSCNIRRGAGRVPAQLLLV